MKVGSHDLLSKLGLPKTAKLELDAVLHMGDAETVYIRSSEAADIPRGRTPVREIALRETEIRTQIGEGRLLSIERCYDQVIGGAVLLRDGFLYAEMVEGHSQSLLRRGCCGARVMVNEGEPPQFLRLVQGWKAIQGVEYVYEPHGEIEWSLVELAWKSLSAAVMPLEDKGPLLLEWLITDEGLLFCDATDSGLADFFESPECVQFDNRRAIRALGRRSSESNDVHIDLFDCDVAAAPAQGTRLVAVNGAALSHYVTRSIPDSPIIDLVFD